MTDPPQHLSSPSIGFGNRLSRFRLSRRRGLRPRKAVMSARSAAAALFGSRTLYISFVALGLRERCPLVEVRIHHIEGAEDDALTSTIPDDLVPHGAQRDFKSLVRGVAEVPRTDAGERDAPQPAFAQQSQTVAVGGSEALFRLLPISPAVNGSHGMDDIACRQ